MAPLITFTWRRLHVAGSTGTSLKWLKWLKHFLVLLVVALALAPGVMGSLSYLGAAARIPTVRQTVLASLGGGTFASHSLPFYSNSDGNGGPTVL